MGQKIVYSRCNRTAGAVAAGTLFVAAAVAGHSAGIAVFDHPDNIRHPTPWYVAKGEMTYFSPALLFNEPYILPAGERLTLRYRILIHAGALGKELLEKEWKSFAESSSSTRPEGERDDNRLLRSGGTVRGDGTPV